MAHPAIERLSAALDAVPAHERATAEARIVSLAASLEASAAPAPPTGVSIMPDETFLEPVVQAKGYSEQTDGTTTANEPAETQADTDDGA